MKNDVIIIGGGAAGLCAAVAIKQKNPAQFKCGIIVCNDITQD